jgi:sugar lactone lactonase YvrE
MYRFPAAIRARRAEGLRFFGTLKSSMVSRLFGFLFLSLSLFAQAQGTRLWQQSTYEGLEKGTPQGVAIRSDGTLESSAVATSLLTTPASYVWSVAVDAHGNAYLGTGSPAMVLKVAPDGKSTRLLETKDVAVQVVRLGPDGMLYAATLPNGRVYRLDPNGPEVRIEDTHLPVYKQDQTASAAAPAHAQVVFDPLKLDPKPTYIWDLAFDAAGKLYVATGGPAGIYRVDTKRPDAAPEKFFSSSEQHIRCMAFAQDGTLYAGSDGRGLVYRITPDGKGFVVFEAPKQEIPALALDSGGNLYVAALGDKGRSNLPQLTVHSAPVMTATLVLVTPGSIESSNDSTVIPDGTVIYQLAPDGTPRELWASPHDVIYSLAWQPQAGGAGALLAGSGNQGHLYRISPDGAFADIAHLEAKQTTALALANRAVYAATSNTGKLYRLAQGSGDSSNYVSRIFDARFFSQWGRAETRGSGDYDLFARVGNIEQPSEGWSDWQKVAANDGETHLPKARFLQWKAVLHPNARLQEVGFNYLPQNVAPVVDEIVVQLHARVSAGMNPEGQPAPVPVNFPSNSSDGVSYQVEQSQSPLMALRARNWATARWKAHDDNGDQLSYSVYYRGDNEANWQLLQQNLRQPFTSFDLDRIPDGGYTLRIVASDAPSHPAGDALTGYKDSGHFLLDTAPPALSAMQATLQGQSIHVRFSAKDALSAVARAYCSVDAGPWQYVEPTGRLSDALQESYDFLAAVPVAPANAAPLPAAVAPAAPQQHVVAVRVYDRAGNVATAKAIAQ